MIHPETLYEDRELTVRRIERLEEELRICDERIDEWQWAKKSLKDELDQEKESLHDIDSEAVKLYGKNRALREGFAV